MEVSWSFAHIVFLQLDALFFKQKRQIATCQNPHLMSAHLVKIIFCDQSFHTICAQKI